MTFQTHSKVFTCLNSFCTVRRNSCKFIEGLVLDGCLPALQGCTLLKLQDFLHDVLPIPFGHLRIDGHEILAQLRDDGVITEADFEQKKRSLLDF